jgi:hypothetical protein
MRCALTWLVLPVLACRALTALYVDLHGPLHFHLADDHHEHHGHAHDHAERHHHAAGDPTVLTLEEHDGFAPSEPLAQGWSSTMCVAAVSADAWPDLRPAPDGVAPADAPSFHTRTPGRLERPPRSFPA